MYLNTAMTIEEVVTFGIRPAIEFLDLAQNERDDGDDDRAAMLELEAKSKLLLIWERLEAIEWHAGDGKGLILDLNE